jgi:hypothetical protein
MRLCASTRLGGIAALVIVAGCGSQGLAISLDGGSSDGGSLCNAGDLSAPNDYLSYSALLRKLACQSDVDCGFRATEYEWACEQEVASDDVGIDPSTLIYNRDAAAQCLADLKQRFCACTTAYRSFDWPSACEMVATGTRPAGSACPTGMECAPGLACALSYVPNPTCSSKCETPAMLGQPCDGAHCFGAHCCTDGAWCNPATSVCESQVGFGQPCTYTVACKAGLICDGYQGMTKCVPPGQPGATCTVYPYEGVTNCAEGLACDSITSTCVTPKAMGQPCSYTNECAPRLFCVGPSGKGTCKPPLTLGASCFSVQDCQWPYVCTNGVCMVPPDVGQPCTDFCLTGFCYPATKQCTAKGTVGSACDPAIMTGNIQCPLNAPCDPVSKTCQLCE